MRRLMAVLVVAAAGLTLAAPASAITYGERDGDRHPNVGALLAERAYSDGTWATCSGTLISPTVFLTAAHCDDGRSRVGVTFDSVYEPRRSKVYWGTWHAHPGYTWSQNDPHDIAVVVFDRQIKGIAPARLPAAGSLANLPADQRFTSVGYGAYQIENAPGGKQLYYEDVRRMSNGTLDAITTSWLRISQNPSRDDGGTCYGDSGGPNFLGAGASETDIVASTTITGDMWCRATNVTYRLDTQSARDFLDDFVTLP